MQHLERRVGTTGFYKLSKVLRDVTNQNVEPLRLADLVPFEVAADEPCRHQQSGGEMVRFKLNRAGPLRKSGSREMLPAGLQDLIGMIGQEIVPQLVGHAEPLEPLILQLSGIDDDRSRLGENQRTGDTLHPGRLLFDMDVVLRRDRERVHRKGVKPLVPGALLPGLRRRHLKNTRALPGRCEGSLELLLFVVPCVYGGEPIVAPRDF